MVSPIFESDHLDLVTLKRGIAISVSVNSITVDNHLRNGSKISNCVKFYVFLKPVPRKRTGRDRK